jgi:hypothetical protein
MTALATPSIPDDRRRLSMLIIPSCARLRHGFRGWLACQRPAATVGACLADGLR